jgi:Tol biopolymer transport system component
LHNNQNGKEQIVRAKIEPYPPKLVVSDENAELRHPRISPDGSRMLYQASLSDRSIEIRITDLAAKQTKTVFKTEAGYPRDYLLAPAWSPDGASVIFNAKAGENTEIFIIGADGNGLQNLTNDPLSDSGQIFSPDGDEIIFVRGFYGNPRLFRMNTDGSNQRRVTEKEGFEITPAFSPDGLNLAFSGDRQTADSRGLDIYLLDFKNPTNENRLTARRFHDTAPAFAPDGTRLAFVATSDGNAEIYLMNADGKGLLRLTRTKAEESAPEFSKDGKKLVFSSNRNGKFAIYEIELP